MVARLSRSSAPLPLLLALGVALFSACGSDEPTSQGVAIRSFHVEPGHLEAPGDVTIRWSTAGAASLELDQGGKEIDLQGRDIAEDSIVLRVLETATFTLTARDAAGASVTSSREVVVEGVAPQIETLTAPEVVQADEDGQATATIRWGGVERAESLRLEAPGRVAIELDPQAAEGSIDVVLEEDTTFELVASNASGSSSLSATVRVAHLPKIDRFDAERSLVGSGETTPVHWSTSNAAYVELWQDEVRLQDASSPEGSLDVMIPFLSSLELRAFNELGAMASSIIQVEVGAPMIMEFLTSDDALWLGDSAVLSWQTRGGSSLTLTVGDPAESICDETGYAEMEQSSCTWEAPTTGFHVLTLTTSNASGITTRELEIYAAPGPIITHFDAAPEVLTAGDELEITWSVLDDPAGLAPVLRLTDDRGNTYSTEGAEGLRTTLAEPGTYELRLEASTDHPRSSPHHATVGLLVHPLPTIEKFAATPLYFDDSVDDEVMFSWATRDAETVVLYRIVEGSQVEIHRATGSEREAGSFAFIPRDTETYRLVATNQIAKQTMQELEIEVAPTEVIHVTATPTAFTQGQQVRLSWQTRMADEVTISAATSRYLLEETDAPYIDLAALGASRVPVGTSDCGSFTQGCAYLAFPEGFSFPFGSTSFEEAWIYTAGFLSFTGLPANANPLQQRFPTNPAEAGISLAPAWDGKGWDWSRYPAGNIYSGLVEEDGKRILMIQWKDVGGNSDSWRTASINFQIALWEDGTFEYRYGINAARDSGIPDYILQQATASIGFQLPDQSDSHQLAFSGMSTNGPIPQRSFRYSPARAFEQAGELVFSPYGSDASFPVTVTATRGGVSHSKTVTLEVARKPLVELIPAEIPPAPQGEDFRLGWKTQYANAVVVVDEQGATRCTAANQSAVEEGSCTLREEAGGRYGYTLRVTGAHGFVREHTVWVDVFGEFSVASFTADKNPAEKGSDVLLQWETFNASSIALFADGTEIYSEEDGPRIGSFLFEGIEKKTDFKLVLTNHVGATQEASLTVELLEFTLDLQTSATSVRPGDPTTITVEARTVDGGAPVRVYGLLPLSEASGPGDVYEDISMHPWKTNHLINQASTSSVVDIPLPFLFPYMGAEYTSLRVFTDGYASLLPTASVLAANVALPTQVGQGVNVHFAPFWDDLHPRAQGSLFSAPIDSDTFVVQWSRMSTERGSSGGAQNLNFQLVLHRDGAFEYRYGAMEPHPTYRPAIGCFPDDCINEVNGSSATIGYQLLGGTAGHTFHFGGTLPAEGNPPVHGGLSNRTLRYPVINGTGSFTFLPEKTETFSICADAADGPFCKEVEIEVPFGITSATLSKEDISFGETTTLSWQSVGGKVLNIYDGETVVHTTSDLAEIDRGSIALTPSRSTTYVIEILAGSRRDSTLRVVDVNRASMTATATSSAGPGSPVTLSWTLATTGPSQTLHIAAPMEEISNEDFILYDLTHANDVTVLIGAGSPNDGGGSGSDNHNVLLTFDDFTFPYFGANHSSVRVAADGYLSWETLNFSTPENVAIPNLTGTNHSKAIAPFWDDLHTRLHGQVLAKKIDADRYVIQWNRMSLRWGSSQVNQGELTFLVVLHRDGAFEFRYSTMAPPPSPAPEATDCYPASCERESNGSSATIGYQVPGGVAGHQIHFGGTHRAEDQQPVPGGLAHRAWKFTPRTGAGSVQVHPADSSLYKICAYEPTAEQAVCANTLSVEVPWGIDLFQINPAAPMAGQPVTLSWSVQGLDSLRVLADEMVLEVHQAPNIPLLGSLTDTLSRPTTYTLEGTSLGRVVRERIQTAPRAFDFSFTGPTGPFVPGETIVLDWQLTPHGPGDVVLTSPMSEVQIEPGGEGAYVDLSTIEGATQVTISDGGRGSGRVFLPFEFPYLGTKHTWVDAFVDGYLSFAGLGGQSFPANTRLPDSSPEARSVHMAIFWTAFLMPSGSVWQYAPDADTMIIQWQKLSMFAGISFIEPHDVNFQVVLRSDGRFEYRYGRMAPPPPPHTSTSCSPIDCTAESNGSIATIGYQSVDARHGFTLHHGPRVSQMVQLLGPPIEDAMPFPGGLSHRTFVYSPAISGSSRIVVGRAETYEACAMMDGFTECKSVRVAPPADWGDLAITELMLDPAAGEAAQWFEVRNLTDRIIDMRGMELRSNLGSHTIADPLPVPPGGFVTLARSNLTPFTPSYVYGEDLPLDRAIDTLEIVIGTTSINTVRWNISWSIPFNQSLSLDPSEHESGAKENSDQTKWCRVGSGGTPGSLGPTCLNPWYEIDSLSDRPFLDISTTGARLHDIEAPGEVARVPTGTFKVKLFGREHGRVWAASNGWISLADTLPTTDATAGIGTIPRAQAQADATKGPLISAFYDVLQCPEGCRFFYEEKVVAGANVLILQWDGYRVGTQGSITFQIQLWENGDVVIAFDEVDNPYQLATPSWAAYEGYNAWVGLEGHDFASTVVSGHFKRAMSFNGRSFLFRPK